MGCHGPTRLYGGGIHNREIDSRWIRTVVESRGFDGGVQLHAHVRLRSLCLGANKMFVQELSCTCLSIFHWFRFASLPVISDRRPAGFQGESTVFRIGSIFTVIFSWFQVNSKIMLSVGGIVIVMASVACSLGLFGYIGVPTALLTIEVRKLENYRLRELLGKRIDNKCTWFAQVIPFLVLAVGVDNIFILVHTHERKPKRAEESIPEHIGKVLADVGPSMLLTSASECFCFLIGWYRSAGILLLQ